MKSRAKSLPSSFVVRSGRFVWTSLWHLMMSQMAPRSADGSYLRPESQFRAAIAPDTDHPAAADRYRLLVGLGCPWAHRTLVVRALKGLESVISVAIVQPSPEAGGWVFEQPELGCQTVKQLYELAYPGYRGRCTVPVLWDQEKQAIVNNESAEIIVILNAAFNEWAAHPELDLNPADLKPQIDRWNDRIYTTVNNGVYRCGFAQTQSAYEAACTALFETLDAVEAQLAQTRYLCGDCITLADVRLFTTLFRFDTVYYPLFKCNRRRIQDYPQLSSYLRDLYQQPGVADTCDLNAVKRDYFSNLFPLNPGGIVPLGPDLDLWAPHDRERSG